ncbi:MAG: DUF2085 domain-containing protein [Chloroflexi bacterium]|nr:DUF2085 domain-containing protein [Chloroflexota bacterium]
MLVNRALLGFSRHWLLIITVLLGIFVGLPWLAPVFMKIGWTGAGKVIYLIYSTQCHQLPQRSFFLFGPQAMYSLSEVQAAWQNTTNPFILRQFVGSAAMGWKVAWSDRMVSMYGGVFLGTLIFWPLRKRLRSVPLWAFVLLILPMAVDGGMHVISDIAGLGDGFRDSNAWLAALTGNVFPAAFYAGDALGSFNSWMRLITGLLFGLAIVWLAYPPLEEMLADTAREIEAKLRRARLTV